MMKLVKVNQDSQLEPFAFHQDQQVILSRLLKKQDLKLIDFLYYADYDLIYQSFQMKHAAYLQKKLTNLSRKQMNQDMLRRFNVASQKNHFKLQKMSVKVDRILSRLQFLWNQKNTLIFHRYYFLKYIQTSKMQLLQNLEFFICTQQKLIKSQSHIIYSIERAIAARQECLRRLRKFLSKLGPEDIEEYLYVAKHRLLELRSKKQIKQYQIQGYKINKIVDKVKRNLGKTKIQEFSQIFHQLTKITLLIIELITQWRQYLYSLTSDSKKKNERIEYYYMESNYLLRIIDDNSFLQKSFLSNYYQFAQKNDPFLFKPVVYLEQQLQNQPSIQSEIPFKKLCLKKVFLPKKQDFGQIMSKIKILIQQFQENIKNRKIFDIKTLQLINNFQLQKLPSIKPLKKGVTKHQASFVSIDTHSSPIQNLTLSMKFDQTKEAIGKNKSQSQKKLFRSNSINSTFRIGPPLRQTANSKQRKMKQTHKFQYMDHQVLKKIKDQITLKVKQDLNLNQFSSSKVSKLFKNPQIADHIDAEVNQMMKKSIYNKFLTTNKKISVTPITIQEDEVDSYLSSIMKQTALKYQFMNQQIQQIRQQIQQTESIYFLKVTSLEKNRSMISESQKDIVLSHLIFKVDYDLTTKNKQIQVIYVSFQNLENLEEIVLKTVEFLLKYQTSSQICFLLYYSPEIQQQKQYMATIKQYLTKNCICVQKRLLKNTNFLAKVQNRYQVKFIFKRKNLIESNQHGTFCLYPKNLHLQAYSLMADEQFQISGQISTSVTQFNFDYILAEIFKNHMNSQDFLSLRSKTHQKWQAHLKTIIQNILALKQLQKFPYISTIQAGSLTQLNRYLTQEEETLHIKCLSPSILDKSKNNHIKLFKFQLTLTVGFIKKSIILASGQKYHRYEINNYLIVRKYKNQMKVYVLPTYQKKNIKILIADAKGYEQTFEDTLNICQKFQQTQQFVQYLWVPMLRYPKKFNEHQRFFMSMAKSKQLNLDSVKKQLLVGHHIEWQSDIHLQNGINYPKRQKDLFLQNPIGLAVSLQPENIVLISTVFNKKPKNTPS